MAVYPTRQQRGAPFSTVLAASFATTVGGSRQLSRDETFDAIEGGAFYSFPIGGSAVHSVSVYSSVGGMGLTRERRSVYARLRPSISFDTSDARLIVAPTVIVEYLPEVSGSVFESSRTFVGLTAGIVFPL